MTHKKRIIFIAIFFLICLGGCADTPHIIKPRLLDPQFSAKKLANKTVLMLPFRDVSGAEGDFSSLENILSELAQHKFPSTEWITPQEINQVEKGLDIGALNAWYTFLNQYHDSGRMQTENILETVLKPQKIDYLLATAIIGHRLGALQNRVYEYFASIIFYDTAQEKFVYDCSFEGHLEYEWYDESFYEASQEIYEEAFSKMLKKIPKEVP